MKTLLATIAIVSATSAFAGDYSTTAHNAVVIQKAPTWDKRITDIYVMQGNTAVIQGKWPSSYYNKRTADTVANGWCIEFDNTVDFLYIVDRRNNKLGGVMCK